MTRMAFYQRQQAGSDADADLDDTIASINLTRLLARLEQNLLSSSSSDLNQNLNLKQLRQSRYHRARVGANIAYAHSLLVQIERSLPKIKSPERRHERQTDLARKRTALKRVKERLEGIADPVLAGEEEEEEEVFLEERDGDGEDLLPLDTNTAAAATPSLSSTSTGEEIDEKEEETGQESIPRAEEAETQPEAEATTTAATAPTLRHRHRQPQPSQTSALTGTSTTTTTTTTTTTSTTTALPTTTTAAAQTKTHLTESTLTAHRLEQESLTESLVTLARQLKASSQAFQSSLEAEKSILARAVDGLDRNMAGLEAAGERMGVLRRMAEGRGWWGRVLLYVWIFVLWMVAVGIVFLGPKVRF